MRPLLHGFHGPGDHLVGIGVSELHQKVLQPLFAEHLVVFVFRLHNAIGVSHQNVAGLHLQRPLVVSSFSESADDRTRGVEQFHIVSA